VTQILGKGHARSGPASALLLGGAVVVLALPSAVLAVSSRYDPRPEPNDVIAPGRFVPAVVDPQLARSITVRALFRGRSFRFTPAATPSRTDNPLTVAVRLDGGDASQALRQAPRPELAAGGLHISPTAYSLGVTRGYASFAQNAPPAAVSGHVPEIPDLSTFTPKPGLAPDASRFAPRIELDGRQHTGRSPRTFEQGDQTVGLGGSYRLTRNLNVTAGVRYSSDRDRLRPLTDSGQDSQAVYVGTQFRF